LNIQPTLFFTKVNVSKYKLLKTLTLLRMEMTKEVPDVFNGYVKVDESFWVDR